MDSECFALCATRGWRWSDQTSQTFAGCAISCLSARQLPRSVVKIGLLVRVLWLNGDCLKRDFCLFLMMNRSGLPCLHPRYRASLYSLRRCCIPLILSELQSGNLISIFSKYCPIATEIERASSPGSEAKLYKHQSWPAKSYSFYNCCEMLCRSSCLYREKKHEIDLKPFVIRARFCFFFCQRLLIFDLYGLWQIWIDWYWLHWIKFRWQAKYSV